MAFVKLGDLCYESPGLFTGTPDEVIDYVDISSVDNSAKCVTGYESIRFAEAPSRARRHAEKGNILVSTVRPNLNAVAMCDFDVPHRLVVSTGFCVLSCKAGVNQDFVFFFCQSRQFIESLVKQATGANYPAVNDSIIRGVMLPAYSYAEQTAIASRLKTLRRIIALRQCQLRTLDTLVKSQFVEMFGDPISNPLRWQKEALDDVCLSIVDCPHSTPKYTMENTGYMCIRTSIVKKNHINWDDIEYISEAEYRQRIQRKKPVKGDIVYTREGAILGIAAVIDRDCNVALGQRSMLLSPNREKILPHFLSAAMNLDSFLENALRDLSGTASPHINVGDIKAFRMIVPPVEKQETFERIVEQSDKSKVLVQAALDKAQTLFDSLMQQYFG
ncbi:MAG: restriction endonuclease subunit S [Clostridia bacterium]|nr:restriction endonuclease subunit S [Clostridia bacterium]